MSELSDIQKATKTLLNAGVITYACPDCITAWPHRTCEQFVFVSTEITARQMEEEDDGWWEEA